MITSQPYSKAGTYDIRIGGVINNATLFPNPCGLGGQCPVIQVGGSQSEIRDYGRNAGFGMSDQSPPEWLRVEVQTDKEVYSSGEEMKIEVYIVNDGEENIVITNGASMVIRITDPEKRRGGTGYIYSIDLRRGAEAEPLVVDAHSKLLLVRPFHWDQKTFDSNVEPFAVSEGRYSISVAISGVEGYAMHDRIEMAIGSETSKKQQQQQQDAEFAGITISIPEGVYEDTGAGQDFDPDAATTSAAELTPFRWKNNDFVLHTATSGTPSSSDIGAVFDTGFIAQGEVSKAFMIDKPGDYPYFCQLHPWMAGRVVVVE